MAFYECIFIARHDMSPNDVDKLAEQYAKVIKDGKGTVVKTENWGLRPLAYPINKTGKGHYVMFGLDCEFPPLAEMERQMGINEDVLRYLTVRVKKMDNKPSVVMKFRSGEDDAEAA